MLDKDLITLIFGATISSFLCMIALCFYRLYIHPLKAFPGPVLAAISGWYQTYYDTVTGGTFVKNYKGWHEAYGPIVRVAPNHLHIRSPQFYEKVFSIRSSFLKDPQFYQRSGISRSLVAIVDPVVHRRHRNVLNPIFSKHCVAAKYPLVTKRIEKGLAFIQWCVYRKEPFDIELLFRRIAMDIVSETLYGFSFNLTDSYEEYPIELQKMAKSVRESKYIRNFPFLKCIALAVPGFLETPFLQGFRYFRTHCRKSIALSADKRKTDAQLNERDTTVFDVVMTSNGKQGFQALSTEEQIDEAMLFISAGTGSTAYTLSCAVYYILTHENVLCRLRHELENAGYPMAGDLQQFDWKRLLKLPYLTAVIQESLRLSTAVPGGAPRIVPGPGVCVDGRFIPAGTIVSMSHRVIHDDPDLYPLPDKFDPSRWLGSQKKQSERWLTSFSRGPRRCLGMNLAYMEIYVCLASMFSRFNFKLYKTNSESMSWVDKGVAAHKSTVKVSVQAI